MSNKWDPFQCPWIKHGAPVPVTYTYIHSVSGTTVSRLQDFPCLLVICSFIYSIKVCHFFHFVLLPHPRRRHSPSPSTVNSSLDLQSFGRYVSTLPYQKLRLVFVFLSSPLLVPCKTLVLCRDTSTFSVPVTTLFPLPTVLEDPVPDLK